MYTLAVLLFLGWLGMKGDGALVTDWASETKKLPVMQDVQYPDGEYLQEEPKQLAWETPGKVGQDNIEFVPTDPAKESPVTVKTSVTRKTAKNTGAKQEINEGIEDLGLLGERDVSLGVSADEILSYFGTKRTTKVDNEESDAKVPSPNGSATEGTVDVNLERE